MAYPTVSEPQHSWWTPPLSRPALVGIAAVALTKAADAVTTWVGLQGGLSEANPFARFLMSQLGTSPALVVLSVVSVTAVVGIIEGVAATFRRFDATEEFVPWLRLSCYVPAVSVHVIVAVHNAALIGGVVG